MRYSRGVRWLVVLFVVTLGSLVAADVVALQVAESRASAGLAQATAAERATVNMGGFPFLPRLLGGRVSVVDLRASGLSGGGLRVARVEARVQDVRFSASAAWALIRSPHADRTRVTTGQSVGQADIAESDLADFMRAKLDVIRELRVTPQGVEVRLDLEDGEVSEPVRFLPRIENRRLVLRQVGEVDVPRPLRDRVRATVEDAIELPAMPPGLTVGAALADGVLTLEASSPRLELLVGEGGIQGVPGAGSGS